MERPLYKYGVVNAAAKLQKETDTIREQQLMFYGHCWRNRTEVVSEVLLWNPQLDDSLDEGL